MCWMIVEKRYIREICLGVISSANRVYSIEKCEGNNMDKTFGRKCQMQKPICLIREESRM